MTITQIRRSELQRLLEDNPNEASTYRCVKCSERIGDSEYDVSVDGIVKHRCCLTAALRLIKLNIEPGTNSGAQLHSAVQIIVTVARERGMLKN